MVLAHAGAVVDLTNTVLVGDGGVGTLIVSNGLFKTANLAVGSQTGSVGRMSISGGRVEISDTLSLVKATTSSNVTATVELSGGTLAIARMTSFSAPGAQSNLWLSGGTLEALASLTNNMAATLTNAPGPGLVTVDSGAFTVRQSGLLSGPGGLAKAGSGILTLSAANDYSGETKVNVGTLRLQTDGAIGSSTQLTVEAGATLDASTRTDGTLTLGSGQTLKGNGTVQGVVANGGTVAPGSSAGTLSLSGNYSQTGTLEIEVGGTTPGSGHDVLAVSGSVTLGGALEVTEINGFTASAGQAFTVLTASAVSGTFATTNVPAGYSVSYSGTEVVLNAAGGGEPAKPYETWADSHNLTGGNRNDYADPDGDANPNLLEYAWGNNPTQAEAAIKVRMTMTNGAGRVVVQRVNAATDVVYYVEGSYQVTAQVWSVLASNVLGSWSGGATVDDNNTGAVHEVRVVDPVSGATNRYLRLRVDRP